MPLWQSVLLVTPARTAVVLLLAPFAVTALLVLELHRAEGMRTAGRIGLVLYASVVIAATFSLSPAETGGGGLSLGSLGYLLSGGENLGSMEKDMIVRQSLANLLMFVPLPVLLRLSWPGIRPWVTLGACVTLTFVIETVQFLVGGGRVADAEDFLLNSLGAGVGLLVFATARGLAALTSGNVRVGDRASMPALLNGTACSCTGPARPPTRCPRTGSCPGHRR
ncbi:VanZ family protein [Streptomyces sp. bgisy022]|uniref:VanZ family protein n=1 Tax=Streptomyces sp. bgisy022 TaxID=3413769 RepID=UPI003D747A88